MKCVATINNGSMTTIKGIPEKTCEKLLDAINNTRQVLEYYSIFYNDAVALNELSLWERNPPGYLDGMIMRKLHIAERLCRAFLFEWRACSDHMKAALVRDFGKNSKILRAYRKRENDAYSSCPEYAFTFHLRNASQHCTNIVHGFCGKTTAGIAAKRNNLLNEYSQWSQKDISFLQNAGDYLVLLPIFAKAYGAMETVQLPVFEHFLKDRDISSNLVFLKEFGEKVEENISIDRRQLAIIEFVHRDGRGVREGEFGEQDISVNAYSIDWDLLISLTRASKFETVKQPK